MKSRILAILGLIVLVGVVLLAYFLGNNEQFQGYLHFTYGGGQAIETVDQPAE